MKKYLVDGYNLLHSWRELEVFSSAGFERMKEELLRMLEKKADFGEDEIEIYFDAFKGPERQAVISGRLKIFYASGEKTADMIIERKVYDAGEKENIRVVTSDTGIKDMVAGMGVLTVSPRQFLAEVSGCISEIDEIIKKQNRR
ncbi:MAG: NYN domain-containing protein [bacterium]|nr:NYN domain-containing protein [bacterium]